MGEKPEQTRFCQDEPKRHCRQFVAVVAAEYAGGRRIDCLYQLIVVMGLKAIEHTANHFMEKQFAPQRAESLFVGNLLQDRCGSGMRAPQAGDKPADGGDFDMASGVADEKNIAAGNSPPWFARRCG